MASAAEPILFLDPAVFGRLKDAVIRRTGHFYYDDKDELLLDRLRRRMRALGLRDLGRYVELLEDSLDAEREWDALAAEITVGETFFFRYAEQFQALRETVLPALIEANRDQRRLRIWSAGCSTGAEAYSVGILVSEMLGDALPDWRVTIIGTDISPRAVAAAQAAEYGAWALRGMPPDDRARYFTELTRSSWALRPRYRTMAQFRQHNLLALLTEPAPATYSDIDLILCRNVLIYFHPDVATAMAAALGHCVTESGYLLFGHAESPFAEGAALAPEPAPGTTLYRRRRAGDSVPLAFRPAPTAAATAPSAAATWEPLALPPSPMPRPAPGNAAAPVQAEELTVELIRSRADVGDIEGALALCRERLAAEPMAPRLHFYEGVLLAATSAPAQAVPAFRRALYLRRHYPIAQYHLGMALCDSGDRAGGCRAIAASTRQLAGMAPGSPLEDGDGMTAANLTDLASHYLDVRTAS